LIPEPPSRFQAVKRQGEMRPPTIRPAILALSVLSCAESGMSPRPGPEPGVPVAYPTGGATLTHVSAADLVGDGHRDLIAVARADNSVRVLPGEAAGGFAGAVALTAGDDAVQAAAGDVDGDGIADLVVVGHLSNAMVVRRGLGANRFGPPDTYPLRNHGNRVVVTDLNGDGFADAVVAHDGSGAPVYVTAWLGSATGALRQVRQVGTNYFTTRGIATGDLDGDGHTDVVLALGDNRAAVLVLRGLGTGEFATPVPLPPLGTGPGLSDGTAAVAVGDLNGDGRDDLVVGCFDLTNQLVIRLSTATGFADPVQLALPGPVDLALGDLNGDGALDIAAPNLGGTLSLLYGKGDGSFGAPVEVPIGPEPASVAVADFDGNGVDDVAVAGLGDDSIRVVLNR
jgi:hypothetical protein